MIRVVDPGIYVCHCTAVQQCKTEPAHMHAWLRLMLLFGFALHTCTATARMHDWDNNGMYPHRWRWGLLLLLGPSSCPCSRTMLSRDQFQLRRLRSLTITGSTSRHKVLCAAPPSFPMYYYDSKRSESCDALNLLDYVTMPLV